MSRTTTNFYQSGKKGPPQIDIRDSEIAER